MIKTVDVILFVVIVGAAGYLWHNVRGKARGDRFGVYYQVRLSRV